MLTLSGREDLKTGMEYTYAVRVGEEKPEQFILLCVQLGEVTRRTRVLNEADLSAKLHQMGFSDEQITVKIDQAKNLKAE